MKFGIFYELSVPRPFANGIEAKVYNDSLEQIRLADEVGFDTVWAVEHHLPPQPRRRNAFASGMVPLSASRK